MENVIIHNEVSLKKEGYPIISNSAKDVAWGVQ